MTLGSSGREGCAEMPDLVIYVSRIFDRLRDFIAQEPSITLPQIMQLFFYHRLRQPQALGERSIRYLPAFRREMNAQSFKKPQPSLGFTFFTQTPQGLFDDRRGPTQIKKPLRRQGLQGLSRDRQLGGRFRHPFIPGDKLEIAPAFARLLPLERMIEKILERLEEKRAKAAAAFVRLPKPVALQDHDKEILSKILRIFGGIPAPADEGKDGAPVSPAEFGQRLAGLSLAAFKLCAGEDKAPAGSGEDVRLDGWVVLLVPRIH
jgi:hypothetical protein